MSVDFASPSRLRQFELVLEGGSLYVNPHYLAEISPYFHALCFADFRETTEQKVELEDVRVEDMVEVLRCVCPDENFTLQRRITADNFAALIYLSSRLLLQNLRHELERLCTEADSPIFDDPQSSTTVRPSLPAMVEILVEAWSAEFPDEALDSLCRRVGRFKRDDVEELIAHALSGDAARPLLQRLQSHFYQAPILLHPRSAYDWNSHSMRLFF